MMILRGTGRLRRRRLTFRQARVSGTAIPETPRSGLEDPSQYVLWRATKEMAQSLRVASPSGTSRLAPSRTGANSGNSKIVPRHIAERDCDVRFVPKADILRCGKNDAIRSLRRVSKRLAGLT